MPASLSEKVRINRVLGNRGLATLDDPAGLLRQLAYLIEDHDELKRCLVRCPPEDRRAMYESLRPNLSFTPKPLDQYVAEAQADAEARQLPTIGPDGNFLPYHVPDIRTQPALEAAQDALDDGLATERLELVCRKCTRVAVFSGIDKSDAVHKAREAGWTYGLDRDRKGREVCDRCP